MTYSKRIPLFVAAAMAATILASPRLDAQTGKIAVIDTSAIIAQSQAGIAAEAEYREWLTPRQQELVDLQNQLTQKNQEFQAQQRALSPEALRTKQAELQNLDKEITRKDEDLQAEASTRQQELLQPVLGLADQALSALASEQNFLMIFDVAALSQQVQGAIVYLSETADLSTEVIRRMDDAYAAAGGTAPETLPPVSGESSSPDAGPEEAQAVQP